MTISVFIDQCLAQMPQNPRNRTASLNMVQIQQQMLLRPGTASLQRINFILTCRVLGPQHRHRNETPQSRWLVMPHNNQCRPSCSPTWRSTCKSTRQ